MATIAEWQYPNSEIQGADELIGNWIAGSKVPILQLEGRCSGPPTAGWAPLASVG